MASSPRIGVEPFFLESARGRIFAVHHRPETLRGNVLCVPGFNEEMNRCRSMVTMLARALAGRGYGTLVIDPTGTGDSDGEYVDGRWNLWQADITQAAGWLGARGGCSALLGVRLGFLQAADWMQANPGRCGALVGWQPVVDGKRYFTQFLRMKLAANLDRPGQPQETPRLLRERLASGQTLEVAGYEIHPELADAIESKSLRVVRPPAGCKVAWLEQRTPGAEVPAPASAEAIADWRSEGVDVTVLGFDGQAFWQLHERSTAPEAVTLTVDWLCNALDLA